MKEKCWKNIRTQLGKWKNIVKHEGNNAKRCEELKSSMALLKSEIESMKL